MIEQFKEINAFFKQNTFSGFDLNELKNNVNEKYKNEKVLRLAKSMIELQILKFEMQANDNVLNKTVSNIDSNRVSKPKKLEKTRTIKPKKRGTEGMSLDEKIEFLSSKSIQFILNEISETESKEKFLNILRKHTIYTGRISILMSIEQYSIIKTELKIILATNKKRDTTLRIKTNKNITSNRSLLNTNTVYDKIKNLNGVGKLIYIRSK
jgi:hypothetical protein